MEQNLNSLAISDGREVFSFDGGDCRRKTEMYKAFDSKFDRDVLNVAPGEYCFLDDNHSMMVATVGTGVCVTIYDEKLHLGIMAYVVLPDRILDVFPVLSSISENDMERAIAPLENAIMQMKQNGAGKKRIRLRLFGGANFSENDERGLKTGIFVREYLSRKGLNVMGEDLGGGDIRRVYFSPDNATVERFVLKRKSDRDDVLQAERDYLNA